MGSHRQYGDDPFKSLTRQGLEGVEKGLINAARAWLDQHSDKARLVLVMDQFEQLLVDRPLPRRQEFLKQLTQLLREPLDVTVVLVMRDDFFSRLAQLAHALVNEALQSGLAHHIPGELDRDELIDIVREPAEAVGLRFESGLIETIIDDALETATASEAGKPVARTTILPLLEFALTQLWEEDHKRGELTHETYNRIGGVTGSLGRWANKAYWSLGEELQPIARRILTDLVHLGSRSEGIPDSRRIRSFDDLCRNTDESQMVEQVVRKLTDARLLVTAGETSGGQSSVQMIHDALLWEWGQLRHWLEENRRFLLWHQELGGRTRAWIETAPNNPNQRDEGRLLRGRALAEAEGWLREHGEDLGEAERKFIEASRQAKTKVQRRLLVAGALFVMVVMVLGAISFWQREVARSNEKEAQMQASIALTRQLLARSSELQESQPDASLLVNVEALQRAPATIREEARFDLLAKLTQPYHVATQLAGHDSNVSDVAFSRDGKLLASSSEDQGVQLWDAASGEARGQPLTGHTNSVNDVAFSKDGNLLASASVDETVRLWDIELESLIADACRIANRNLSEDEWSRIVGPESMAKYERTCSSVPVG